jgi:2-oxoglutarate ferredoxin oxidoreductase subunit beta
MDNRVYGMTKGQPSPTTEPDWDSDLIPGGSSLPPFNPIAMAITAGASFVARGFAGDAEGLADLIVQGIRWRGFAFLEVLSPCITFRPEQFDWKDKVQTDAISIEGERGRAITAALREDGFSLGVLFRGPPASPLTPPGPVTSLEMIEHSFEMELAHEA